MAERFCGGVVPPLLLFAVAAFLFYKTSAMIYGSAYAMLAVVDYATGNVLVKSGGVVYLPFR